MRTSEEQKQSKKMKDDSLQELVSFETYVILKKADPGDEIEMTHIMNFCSSMGHRPCDDDTHEYCLLVALLPEVYCAENPIERDYRKYVTEVRPATKKEYLLMRLAEAHINLH